MADLERKLKKAASVVGVAGHCYVGLPLAFTFSQAGLKVLGLNIPLIMVKLMIYEPIPILCLQKLCYENHFSLRSQAKFHEDFPLKVGN